ncbi:MAG: GNAT family N-acetyltransferase [Candidatus Zixiibacteriota bacterium]
MIAERITAADLSVSLDKAMRIASLLSNIQFADLWRAQGGTPAIWQIRDHDKVIAALLGVEFRFSPLTRFQAMPDGLYARPWIDAAISLRRSDILEALTQGISRHSYARTHLADLDAELDPGKDWSRLDCETTMVEIADPAWEPPDPTIRSEIRKAEREGIVVTPFDSTKHMTGFLTLMQQTESRHGRQPKYSSQFYRELAGLAESDDRIQWIVAERGDELAASHIYLLDRDTALYWQAHFDKKYSFLKPNQYMLALIAAQLRPRGIRKLNLGSSSGGSESLQAYKEKWGGVTHPYPLHQKYSFLGKLW